MSRRKEGDSTSGRIFFRRIIFGGLVGLTTLAAAFQWLRILLTNGFQPLEWPMFALLAILVAPIALSFWTAAFGFLVQMRGGDELALGRMKDELAPIDFSGFRTAVVIPAYNEDAAQLFASLKATYESVERTGLLGRFDFFVLSDSTHPDAWIREELGFADLRERVSDPERLFYRNRLNNIDRKAGNIADFCARWGDRYRYMIVFDADSIMTGQSMVKLVRLMERHSNAGIIQTPPAAVNRRSLFGRVLQFATRAYSPIYLRGLNYWQAGEGNYYGHNAIIRVRPFMDHCRLPKLPGKEPLGGSILSHDFVEAALMRRAGWKVYAASDLRGSFEGAPANLIGHAARDRRWCQGNLQHARLLGMKGLHWVSRLHLLMGVMAYVSSPLWVALLFLSTAEGLRQSRTPHEYFTPDASPFPNWEISIVSQMVLLFTSVMFLLIFPKFLSLIAVLARQRRWVTGFGGSLKFVASVFSEILFSVLLAPVMAMLHTLFVVGILLGKKVEWNAQDRGDAETSWGEAVRRHAGITALGVVWALLLLSQTPQLFWWFSPVLAGLVFSIPLSVWSSKAAWGQCARKTGVFLTPEEVRPPLVLRRYSEELRRNAEMAWASQQNGLAAVLQDPEALSIHLSLLPQNNGNADPMERHRLDGLRLKMRTQGESALSLKEKRELLSDAKAILALRDEKSAGVRQ